ncbi:hypothetical protein BDW69DRAFT_195936 [Aspergillus filifer]
MQLNEWQLRQLSIAGRTASALSILGVATIIVTFCYSPNFRSLTHRIMLINASYNLFNFIATMISLFPVADVLWTLAMTWDVVLVVLYHYEPEALLKLEKIYLAIITTLTDDKGPLYGSVTFWCSISPNWVLFRIIFYYGPSWFLIVVVFVLYIVVAHEIFRLRHELMLTRNNRLVLCSTASPNNEFVERTVRNDSKASDVPTITHQSSLSLRRFILMPVLFFLALLTTWVTPTINRIYVFRHPGEDCMGLRLGLRRWGRYGGF